MSEAEIIKIKIDGIKEMLLKLNQELPFPGHISASIIKKYLNELEERLWHDQQNMD